MMHNPTNEDHQLYYFGDQIKHSYMSGTCTCMGKMRNP